MYDLDEQQQLEIIKAWLVRHGKWLAFGIFAVFAGTVVYLGYHHYAQGQAEKASALYESLLDTEKGGDLKKIRLSASAIAETYPDTPYAARGALIVAGHDADAGDANDAKLQLQWVLDHGKEAGILDVARLRLARILLDEKKYAEAIGMLDGKHEDAFDGLYSDLKGDIYAAEGKRSEARSAYLVAYDKIQNGSPYRNVVSIKLDSMGGTK